MQQKDDDWHALWVIDEDVNAAAQAVHVSGLGISIYEMRAVDGLQRWVSESSDRYRLVAERLRRDMGEEGFANFYAERRAEALRLWRDLGHLDGVGRRQGPRPEPAPCRVLCWRSQWKVCDDALSAAHALHSSGFGFNFIYTEVNNAGELGWRAVMPLHHEALAATLRRELGDESFEIYMGRLLYEARLLWLELGYTDDHPFKAS